MAGAGRVPRFGLRDLTVHRDARGSLVALEGGGELGFDIARVFYIFGNEDGLSRAGHRNTVDELIICVAGSCRAHVDDGHMRGDVMLTRRDQGLWVPKDVWLELVDFTPDCVLLVLANGRYRPDSPS